MPNPKKTHGEKSRFFPGGKKKERKKFERSRKDANFSEVKLHPNTSDHGREREKRVHPCVLERTRERRMVRERLRLEREREKTKMKEGREKNLHHCVLERARDK